METHYDVVVLGGGVGGYTAAIQAAKHHLKVALVEAQLLGGVCLNQGCIPTKAYLKSAEVLRTVQKSANFGLEGVTQTPTVAFQKVFERKEAIVKRLRQGVTYLMQKNKITVYPGYGQLIGPNALTVKQAEQTVTLNFKTLILATGSTPKTLDKVVIDDQKILTSESMLQQTTLPKRLTIIGGGAIGLEWASLLHDLGTEVQVLEYADHLLGQETAAAGQFLKQTLTKRGIKIQTAASVTAAELVDDQVQVTYLLDGQTKTVMSDQVLVAVGRQAQTSGMGLAEQGILLQPNGTIAVDENYQTNQSQIFAVGDCIDTLQLAHVAMAEGIHAADFIAKQPVEPLDYAGVPRCIYTYPEVAVAGASTIDQQQHPHTKVGTFPYSANGKAIIEGETTGQIQVTIDTDTDDVLQVLMIGTHATDMIAEASLGLYLNVSAAEIGAAVHPHPTLSETVRQAALAAKDWATDI